MNLGKFTMGADPELFLSKKEKWMSAIPLIKGTKEKPEKLPSGATLQHDNVAAEFAIEPANSKTDFVQKIAHALSDMKTYLPDNIDMNVIASCTFPVSQLKHKEARRFGCDPDRNAYTRRENKAPEGCEKKPFRSCGGHLHTGFVAGSENLCLTTAAGKIKFIKMCDLFHGVVSAVLDSDSDALKRRELYGKAGCYRPTKYGAEYRTLSNYWLKSPVLVKLMYSLTNDVLTVIRNGASNALLKSIPSDQIRVIIEEGRVHEALELIKNKLLSHMSIETKTLFDIAFFDTMNYEFEKEWGLTK